MAPRYELAVGLRRGHKTTKIERVGKVSGKELAAKSEKLRQARTKGVSYYICINCCVFFFFYTTLSDIQFIAFIMVYSLL